MSILTRSEDVMIIKNLEKDVRNKWQWSWMEKSVTVKTEKLKEPLVMCLKDYIRKVNNISRKCSLFMYEVILLKDNACITF